MSKQEIVVEKYVKYKDKYNEYTVQLVHKRNWWWLLLLLLLLLFVKCERNIDVTTINKESKEPVPSVKVNLSYTAHYLYSDGRFFANEDIERSLVTDDDGNGTFEKLPCSVFSYIFYCLSRAQFQIEDSCHDLSPSPTVCNFHFTRHKNLNLCPKTVDLPLIVVDRETEELLAGATIYYTYDMSEKTYQDSLKTNPAGSCLLEKVPLCDIVNIRLAKCYGYKDTTDVTIKVQEALACIDSSKVKLTPIKERFEYFVKNKYTKQPIPGATAEITLISKNNVIREKTITNVDGKGVGVYKDAFILANLKIKASKAGYKDGELPKDYIVKDFIPLPEDDRTILLEPEPYMEEFVNVDSLTGKPIAGVLNRIHIESINGENYDREEVSNRNGVFYIKAIEDDKIEIVSTLERYYYPKKTVIDHFKKGQKIPLTPKTTNLVFRTIDGETGDILPDCRLVIRTSDSNVTMPYNSGNGTFTVEGLLLYEKISIVASKPDYSTNADKVRNAPVEELISATQERRDIPLYPELPPCNEGSQGKENVPAFTVSPPASYNMGVKSGKFEFNYETGTTCSDRIIIYNHNPGEPYTSGKIIFDTGQVIGTHSSIIPFSNGSIITIIVETGPSDGSIWNYHVSCPI